MHIQTNKHLLLATGSAQTLSLQLGSSLVHGHVKNSRIVVENSSCKRMMWKVNGSKECGGVGGEVVREVEMDHTNDHV